KDGQPKGQAPKQQAHGERLGEVKGQEPLFLVPFHPDLNPMAQFQPPTLMSRRLVESFARFVMHQPHPDQPEYRPVRVKVYRVIHRLPPVLAMAQGVDPCHPTYYLPFYQGEFDGEGNLTREAQADPFLYWLLPILPDNPNDPESTVRAYVYKHAGDSGWVRHR